MKYGGFEEADIRAAFEKVADPNDWKGPIEAIIRGEEIPLVAAAIEFFTATPATVAVGNMNLSEGLGFIPYVVTADGYRAGPAGDH